MSTLRLNKLSFFDSSDSSVAIDTGSILTGTSAQFKITGGTANQALVTDGAGNLSFTDVTSDPTMGGDLSGLASAAQIVAGAVGTAEIATDAVTANEIATDAVGSSEIATGAVGASEIASTIDLSSKTVTLPAASVIAHIPPLPTVTSLTYPGGITNLNPAGGETLIITGTNFVSGMEVQIGLVAAPTITVDSSTQITITTPTLASATYTLVVIHPGGHRGSISVSYSTSPSWTTPTGSLGSMTELTAGSFTVLATSDSTITYSQQSGTLPSGITLAPSTGIISGTGTSDLAADTAYNFTLRATDIESQTSDRAFGITVNAVPAITSLDYPGDDTALDPVGAQILIITGASFEVGITTTIDSTSVAVTRDSATQLTIPSTPAKTAATYTNGLVATNPSGLSATADVSYSNLPAFNVAAGTLGSFDGQTAISITLDATGDAPLTYALTSGALPTGITLNTTTGVVSGTTPQETDDTTYNFTLEVTDLQNQSVSRAYSFIVLSFQVGNSLMFDYNSDSYLHYTPSAAGNQKTWTFSGWFKRGNLTGGVMTFFSSDDGSSSNRTALGWSALEEWEVAMISSSQTNAVWSTSELARDPAAWYHFVCALDTTESTAADRLKLYVNGERITSFRQSPAIDLNGDYDMNSSGGKMVVGRRDYATDRYYDGYLAEVYFIDGQALDASSFGELDSTTNQWIPIYASGLTFGTNGFYLKFRDSAALGDDSSGNTNDFTPTNLVATDQMVDTPMNNFCTMNPLTKASDSYNTLKEGNLHLEATGQGSVRSTFAMSSGKWYWECLVTIEPTWWPVVGFGKTTTNVGTGNQNYTGEQADSWGYKTDVGQFYIDGSIDATYTSVSAGDIMQFALDIDAGKAWVGINDTWVNSGVPASGTNAIVTSGLTGDITPIFSDSDAAGHDLVANFGQDSSFAGAKTAQGNSDSGTATTDFYYTPPSGFLGMCTQNLSDPVIADPGEHFNTVLYTGTGSVQSITGVGFQPDFVWLKKRNAIQSNGVFDSVRGVYKVIGTDHTNPEGTNTNMLTAFGSDGFTLGTDSELNSNTNTFVSWNWKGDTTPTQTYIVTVAGSQDYYIDGFATAKPTMHLQKGGTYTFDESDSTNSSHLFAFSTTADGTFGGGAEYTTGVTHVGTPGQSGAYTRIVVDSSAPNQLYYYCVYHGSMGGDVTSSSSSSNFQGTIASAVNANTTAGFSIIEYTGNGTVDATFAHGLSTSPDMIIIKNLDDAKSWMVWTPALGSSGGDCTYLLNLDGNGVPGNWCGDTIHLNGTTKVEVASGSGDFDWVNKTGVDYISYCFHSVEGYSKVGQYEGNSNADGPFVYCGFRPAYILEKNIDASGEWNIWDVKRDTYNYAEKRLSANTNAVEDTGYTDLDILSNGFKFRRSSGSFNTSGNTNIYIAFAESPFKTSNAR
jgi:hypothetical protein